MFDVCVCVAVLTIRNSICSADRGLVTMVVSLASIFDISRLYGDGGMPSGHSATVSSLVMITGLTVGFDTFEFAIAFVVALIVCHDATGVRRETGKQALLLKEIIKSFEVFSTKKLPEVMLKEFVGHTPVQVFAGILVGIVNAMILQFLVFI